MTAPIFLHGAMTLRGLGCVNAEITKDSTMTQEIACDDQNADALNLLRGPPGRGRRSRVIISAKVQSKAFKKGFGKKYDLRESLEPVRGLLEVPLVAAGVDNQVRNAIQHGALADNWNSIWPHLRPSYERLEKMAQGLLDVAPPPILMKIAPDRRELAERLTVMLVQPDCKIFLHGKNEGWHSAEELTKIVEEELSR